MEEVFTFHNLASLLSLSGLEIVLGIDNVIFLAIIIYHIPPAHRARVRFFGISLAIALRIIMLCGVSWVMGLTKPLFSCATIPFSGRSLLLLAGGIFLIIKSVTELYDMITARINKDDDQEKFSKKKYNSSQEFKVILQIIFVDLVLSFDSVIVAVGMVNKLYLIIPAIFFAMIVMLMSAKTIGNFMYSNPSIKALGVGFVFLVGGVLCVEGFGVYVPKSYLYTAMFFSLFVEMMNIRMRKLNSKI